MVEPIDYLMRGGPSKGPVALLGAEAGKEAVRSFLADHIDEILRLAEGVEPSAARRGLIRRLGSLLVSHFCLKETGVFFEDVRDTPLDVPSALDGINALQEALFKLLLQQGVNQNLSLLHLAMESAFEELRDDYVRLTQEIEVSSLNEDQALEVMPEALFLVSPDGHLDPLNRSARWLLKGAPGGGLVDLMCDPRCASTCRVRKILSDWSPQQLACTLRPERRASFVPTGEDRGLLCLSMPKLLTGPPAQTRSVLQRINSGVVLLNPVGRIIFINEYAQRVLGAETLGLSIKEVMPGLKCSDDGCRRRIHMPDAGNAPRVLSYRIMRCVVDGFPRLLLSLRDVTEIEHLRESVERLKRLSEVGRMCAVVAHEIRNPLAGIMATIQSIAPEAEAAGLKGPLDMMEEEVERLKELLNGFFSFVRQSPPARRACSIERVTRLALKSAGERLAELHVVLDCSGLGPVWIDGAQFQQVLLNLFLNAAEAKANLLKIRARVKGERLDIKIQDDGCGVALGHQAQVFDAFFTTKQTGTGLGLSVCYMIVNGHGGTIRFHSVEGGSTEVWISVPAYRDREKLQEFNNA